MKKILKALGITLGMTLFPIAVWAVQVTVPSAPSSGYALISTTTGNYIYTLLPSCSGASNALTFNVTSNGYGCNSISSGGGAYPFTPATNYGVTNQATTGIPWFQNGMNASSTSHFVNASSTLLSVSSIFRPLNGSIGINVEDLQLLNNGVDVLDWQNKSAYDASAMLSVDWGNRTLNDTGGSTVLNFSGTLNAPGNFWANTYQYNGGSQSFVDGSGNIYLIGGHQLIDSSGNTDILGTFTLDGAGNGCATFTSSVLGSTGSPCTPFVYPFSILTNFGTTTAATTTPIWAKFGIFASSTSQFVYASTTMISSTISSSTSVYDSELGTPAGSFVAINPQGKLISTTTPSGGSGTPYPFNVTTPTPGNATSTLTQFNGGLTAFASSTIGGGTQTTGLTVNGIESIGNGPFFGQSVLAMSSSSPSFVQAYIQNTANTATSSANFVVNNNLSTNSTYYGEFGINSSAYNELGFSGQSGNDVFLSSSDSNLDIGTASSTGPNNVNFLVGGQSSTNLVARIGTAISFFAKMLGIGTTTPTGAQVVVASSTSPQIIVSDGTGTSAGTFIRNTGGTTYIGSTTAATNATSTIPAIQINSTGYTELSIATSSQAGILNLGPNPQSTTSSSTIVFTNRIQFDGYTSGGTRFCVWFTQPGVMASSTGPCNN